MRSPRRRLVVAAALASLVVIVLIAGVILTTTTAGCGPAQRLSLQGVLSLCPRPTPVAAVVPTPSPSSSAAGTPSVFGTPSPSKSVVAGTPASGPAAFPPFKAPTGSDTGPTFDLNCRLPVYAGPPGSGGFITFPGGNFIADPASASKAMAPVHAPSPPPSLYTGGFGSAGLSYSSAYSRWLPIPFSSVTPDGSRFIYESLHSTIYVVKVATGDASEVGVGRDWHIIGVENEGIYATIPNTVMDVPAPPGLWLIAYSGAVKQITKTGYWQVAASGAAYGEARLFPVGGGPNNTIIRLDLKTNAVVDWFTRGGGRSTVYGIDATGNALISVDYTTNEGELWITAAPMVGVPIFSTGQGLSLTGHPIADSHGIWLPMVYNASAQGVALYVMGDGLYWMSGAAIQPTKIQAESGTQLANGCV